MEVAVIRLIKFLALILLFELHIYICKWSVVVVVIIIPTFDFRLINTYSFFLNILFVVLLLLPLCFTIFFRISHVRQSAIVITCEFEIHIGYVYAAIFIIAGFIIVW